MIFKNFIVAIFFFQLTLFGCQSKQLDSAKISQSELTQIKRVALKEFNHVPAGLFNDQESCLIKGFISKGIEEVLPYYDRVVFGFNIKYYQTPIEEYSFCIIKDLNNGLHCLGKFETKEIQKLCRKDYVYQDGIYKSPEELLTLKQGENSVLFNRLFAFIENIYSQLLTNFDHGDQKSVINNLIFSIYNELEYGVISKAIPSLEILQSIELLSVLTNFKKGQELNEQEKSMYESLVSSAMEYHQDQTHLIFNYKNLLVIIFDVKLRSDSCIWNKSYITRLSYEKLLSSGLDFKKIYPQCY